MRQKHVHIHALYVGSLIITFVLGGMAAGFIGIPNLSSAAGISALRVGGNLTVGGATLLFGTVGAGGDLAVAGAFTVGTASAAPAFAATGGTITQSGGFTIHKFTSSGTFTPNGPGTVEALVVAGGGGGGQTIGGGGGAGGVIQNAAFAVTASPIVVTVGTGGAGAPVGCDPNATYFSGSGSNGANSTLGSLTAIGGGGGGNWDNSSNDAKSGGSGGGGGGASVGAAAPGTAGQGNAGGVANGNQNAGAGGGGAGAVGANGVSGAPGAGGAGISSSISGASLFYAGGGGGGGRSLTSLAVGAGGNGGGGSGSATGAGANGASNTGGGGGGGGDLNNQICGAGGNGGSGIVIVRYRTNGVGAGTVRIANGVIAGDGSGLTNLPAQLPASPQIVKSSTVVSGTIAALCPAGTFVTGGGCENAAMDKSTAASIPKNNGWFCRGSFGSNPAAHAICLPAQ